MIKILINESDKYFEDGIMHLLRGMFLYEYGQEVEFLKEFSPYNICNANVILLSLLRGEASTCKKEFRGRTRGVVIGLTDTDAKLYEKTPLCYRDMVFISRRSTRKNMYSGIFKAWGNKNESAHVLPDVLCADCPHVQLSEREYIIAVAMMSGMSTNGIAHKLNVSEKTVYAHKYSMMRKFNIDNKRDLFDFLTYISQRDEGKCESNRHNDMAIRGLNIVNL